MILYINHDVVPSDHTSIFASYGIPRITSGARYDLDCTYVPRISVEKHDEPKSITLTSQVL